MAARDPACTGVRRNGVRHATANCRSGPLQNGLGAELQIAGPLHDLYTAAAKVLVVNLSRPLIGPNGIDVIGLARTAAWARLSPAVLETGFAVATNPAFARILIRRINSM